ncbi:MAG: thiamine pyrophosphate-binding protein [Defluviicoccus sp.]|nr:thiamine pyrophosphate-binding protein [Defluviicoccus sp.]
MRTRTGGRTVVDALRAHGCERIFTVPGESFLGLLDALYDVRETIDVVTCRHEGGAGFMAEASAKLTGRPGVCVVSRGPGACNAAIAVHTARQDSTPMLLLIGQVSRPLRGREAFQEVDHARFFAPLAKHAGEVSRAEDLPAAIARAFFTAEQGRAGPVVLALPEDLLREEAAVADVDTLPVDLPEPDPGLMERLHTMLGDAERPLVIAGGGGWTERARADLARFADVNGLTVTCTFRRNDILDNDHPSFVGTLGIAPDPLLVNRIRAADLVIAIGTRLGEVPTQGYTLFGPPAPTLVHVYPDGREIGRVFPAELAIEAAVAPFMAHLARLAPIGGHRWHDWTAAARADYLADRKPLIGSEPAAGVDLGQAMAVLDGFLSEDAIITVDAGNFSGWPHRFLRHGGGRRLLGACNGAMGYGIPAALAAKRAFPQREVIAFVGDGGFGMTGAELLTALQIGAGITVLVCNNSMYGTIRMHQERRYPGRPVATALTNPSFADIARAFGAEGFLVKDTAAFAPALEAARQSGRPAVIEIIPNAEQVSTRAALASQRATR